MLLATAREPLSILQLPPSACPGVSPETSSLWPPCIICFFLKRLRMLFSMSEAEDWDEKALEEEWRLLT